MSLQIDRIVLVLSVLCLLFTSPIVLAQESTSVDGVTCTAMAGADKLWQIPSLHYLFVGEIHGTGETPAAFADLVCAAAQATDKRIMVALEFSVSERAALNAFMASPGAVDDEKRFLDGWWANAMTNADGRTSEAMWELVRRLRTMRAAGLEIGVTVFQPLTMPKGAGQELYEQAMAANLQQAFEAGDYELALVLVGNLHARKAVVEPGGAAAFAPMAMHLPAGTTFSLVAVGLNEGTAWNCQQDGCKLHTVAASRVQGVPPGINVGGELVAGYDGVLAVAEYSSSPPLPKMP